VIVLGDQLDRESAAFDDFDPARDALWMAEVREEASHVPSGQPRIALFLAAMRHYRDEQRARGVVVYYRELADDGAHSLAEALAEDLARLRPARVAVVQPGEWRVLVALRATCATAAVALEELDDRHFLSSPTEFAAWAAGRREWRLEHYYRALRRRLGILMDGEQPCGGEWNFDKDNRRGFPAAGPGLMPPPLAIPPDAVTQAVCAQVRLHYADRPGDLSSFDWPVTPADAQAVLADFIAHRLPMFGTYQDAMWQGEPWLYHSRLSAALNLKLLHPAAVIAAAQAAYRRGDAPIASVEGFIRQILGWREYVRGVYWHAMPDYGVRNELGASTGLPAFYWTGDTDRACLRDAIGQSLNLGYAHHIQRLMVTGLYALLLGVRPREVHEWYLAVYVDAVEWVELPNVYGMSQYADGGLLASKPYIASGRYIDRMSNYCQSCRYRPEQASGPDACPFTTLYWDFLDRHAARFARHPRLGQQVRNLQRMKAPAVAAIRDQARALRDLDGSQHGTMTGAQAR
jgi:deoxyribodipyrimidine photolyase-related protein